MRQGRAEAAGTRSDLQTPDDSDGLASRQWRRTSLGAGVSRRRVRTAGAAPAPCSRRRPGMRAPVHGAAAKAQGARRMLAFSESEAKDGAAVSGSRGGSRRPGRAGTRTACAASVGHESESELTSRS